MSGAELMQKLIECDQARRSIPLQLQATLPLPGRRGRGTAECWYYHLACNSEGVTLYSPACYALWDISRLEILEIRRMKAAPLGDARDVLTREHRDREDAYLDSIAQEDVGGDMREGRLEQWLAAAPGAMRSWLEREIKEMQAHEV